MNKIIHNYAQFLDYCIYGKLEEAQNMVFQNIISLYDIDEDIFSYTCYFGQITIAKWIYSLNPEKYKRIIDSQLIKIIDLKNHQDIIEWIKSITI